MTDIKNRPAIGVSACLHGQAVRFDGGFIKNRFVLDDCTEHFDLLQVCPEVECGMSIPRPTIQLRRFDEEVRLVHSRDPDNDVTDQMLEYSHRRIDELPELDGYIFKKDSPSCGPFKVAIKDDRTGMRSKDGRGVFADVFMRKHPNVPVEDEGRLNDRGIRENFLERVYAHYRWRQVLTSDDALVAFRDFHRNHKYILMGRNSQIAKQLGRMAAGMNRDNFDSLQDEYFSLFMKIMRNIPRKGHHVNVMQHLMGYLKKDLEGSDKAELLRWFESYRQDEVSRVTPLALLKHHLGKYGNDYIAEQYYLSPFPEDLMHPV